MSLVSVKTASQIVGKSELVIISLSYNSNGGN
jgi:hypothetical protein